MVSKHLWGEIDRQILEAIMKDKEVIPVRLVNQTNSNYKTILSRVNKMVDKGIIKRKPHPESNRATLLTYSYDKLKIEDFIELLRE